MIIDTNETLLKILHRTQLLGPEQLQEIERELVPTFDNPHELGAYLVEIDWLTAYQLGLVLTGRLDELTIGPYQILASLGQGGVSQVFRAWDTVRGRMVALKVLQPDLVSKPDVVARFRRELQAITRLSHPNIVKSYDVDRGEQLSYFALELVAGVDLGHYVGEVGPLSVEQACDYARQIAQALQAAHQVGMVHRDIKPANVLLTTLGHRTEQLTPQVLAGEWPKGDNRIKIIDWGLARCARETGNGSVAEFDLDDEKGSLLGTADYIAPEQARDPTLVDIRADIYSLGCTLFYLLTGSPPFAGANLMQKLLQHQETPPPSVKAVRPEVPDDLEQIIHKMLAKEPAERYQIPLLVAGPLRRFCNAGRGLPQADGSANGASQPASLPHIASPTSMNLPRPETLMELSAGGKKDRPGSSQSPLSARGKGSG
jgi:serine/threonine-protein kinase